MEKELIFPRNAQAAAPMEKYLKQQFVFCGVPKPLRAQLEKPYLKASRTWSFTELYRIITTNYAKATREYQYYSIDLALENIKRLSASELSQLLPLIGEKSWWETVDSWRKVFGEFLKLHPESLTELFYWFYGHEDFWYRRIAINLQLQQKTQTDVRLLEKAILADRTTDEFFIQKAIGWSLREYSKTDPDWVRQFIAAHELSKLAVREASKYL